MRRDRTQKKGPISRQCRDVVSSRGSLSLTTCVATDRSRPLPMLWLCGDPHALYRVLIVCHRLGSLSILLTAVSRLSARVAL